jgi:hypothetical protein
VYVSHGAHLIDFKNNLINHSILITTSRKEPVAQAGGKRADLIEAGICNANAAREDEFKKAI